MEIKITETEKLFEHFLFPILLNWNAAILQNFNATLKNQRLEIILLQVQWWFIAFSIHVIM